jgi:hypothetical protein
MQLFTIRAYSIGVVSLLCVPAYAAVESQRDYPIQPTPFTSVHLNDAFWAPRIEVNRKVTIPSAFEKCELTGRVDNFIHAAEALRGQIGDDDRRKIPGYPFDDTDIYKVIEGASYALSVHPDPKLDAYVDSLIAKIAAAQESDGYLYTARTINPEHPHEWSGKERWEKEEVLSHELYNLGHLYEAAAAHYQATGKRTLLDISLKSADLLCNTFGPGKRNIYPGHQIVEMGLVKLYRISGQKKYLELAKFMLDDRGPGGNSYNQANLRVIDQMEAVGHAVRATYMYSGMADVAAMTGDQAYIRALDAIWNDVAGKKLYITGGIGAKHEGEAFGPDYFLPNMTAYNETCASIGNDYWNQRMFLLEGDAKYIDVLERTLYNGLISGVSLDGKTFFYPNPLESNGQHQRQPWFGCACCPGNVTRFMASLPGYMYAVTADTLYVNLFAGSKADVTLGDGRKVAITQETQYPWQGRVKITLNPETAGRFAVKVRIPGWARGEVVPSDLYKFADGSDQPIVLKVNGTKVDAQLDKGYAKLDREWKAGDAINLDLPMQVRRVRANEKVEDDRHRVAIERGPIVYAAEWPDNAGKHVRNLILRDNEKLTSEFKPALLGGVTIVKSSAVALSHNADGSVKRTEQEFMAIPYYAWANRGSGQMEVWIATEDSAAKPSPWPTLAILSKVTASGEKETSNGVKAPGMINDGEEPQSSSDRTSFYDWAPAKGQTAWVEYAFPKIAKVSESDVYWLAEQRGEVKAPATWRVLYREGQEWRPVENASAYGTEADKYNKVAFKPVTTNGLRLELTMQKDASAGILEWKVK